MVFTIKYRGFLSIFPSSNSMNIMNEDVEGSKDDITVTWEHTVDGCEIPLETPINWSVSIYQLLGTSDFVRSALVRSKISGMT